MITKFNIFKLNEMMEFPIIQTNYSVSYTDDILNYVFTTTTGNTYSVYFYGTKEKNIFLDDNTYLYSYHNTNINTIIPTIFFSETKHGLNKNYFNKLTNYNEFVEVMGKVVYLMLEFINKNNFKLYSIGEVDKRKFEFYKHWLKHLDDFYLKSGLTENYLDINENPTLAYYLIKK